MTTTPVHIRPNFLWISLEDVSPRFGCYGDPVARTPNIDALAASGRRYPHAFCTAGVCAPSRCSIITGMYATSIGAHHMRTGPWSGEIPTLPGPYEAVPPPHVRPFTERLRGAGYFCTNNKKTDYQFAAPRTAWDMCGDDAHWRHRDGEQPFFAVFNPTVTHESGMWEEKQQGPLKTDPNAVEVPPYLPDTPRVRQTLARHYDNLEHADRAVGDLLDQLAADGLAESTIVFLWSDHGEGLPRGKRWPYDSGIRIPLIVRWPGALAPGSIHTRLVSLIDLGPTVLSLAGLPVPLHMQGQAFLGPEARQRRYVYAHRDRHGTAYDRVRAVRGRRFKYIRNYHPEQSRFPFTAYRNRHPVMQELWRLRAEGGLEADQLRLFAAPRPEEELYDCEQDPWEVNNLADQPQHRETLLQLRQELNRWEDETGDLGGVPEEELVQRLWPGGEQPETAAPIFAAVGRDAQGTDSTTGGTFEGPLLVQIHVPTQGASVAYRLGTDAPGRWRLYAGPIPIPAGTTTIEARANRLGFKESGLRRAEFTVSRGARDG